MCLVQQIASPPRRSSLLINLSTSPAIKIHFQPAIAGPRSVLQQGKIELPGEAIQSSSATKCNGCFEKTLRGKLAK